MFANGGFALYSDRMQLPVDEYVAVMGMGTSFATMSADDSTVLMDDGEFGVAGEYTYRTTLSGNPPTFNQWTYDDATSSDVISLFTGALYDYEFNADKTGYVVVPSMAASVPDPVDGEMLDSGTYVSKTWQITLRDDLVWSFHDDIDTTGFDMVIDANDYVYTYQLALDLEWFRAVSGGGDFLNATQEVVGAQAYVDAGGSLDGGTGDWATVGINLIDDLTFEFVFENDMSEWNVKYWLSSFVMTAISEDLYDAVGDQYGTSATTIAGSGIYDLDYYEADKVLRYSKNDTFAQADTYFFTHYTQMIIEESATRFDEFIAGKTDSATLPSEDYEDYANHPGLVRIPGATTFRMMINGLGTEEAQREQFPDGSWIPEPILANQDFKMALYFAIDRLKLAEEVLKTSTTQMYLFSDAYLVDAELGIPYRDTDAGISVGDGLSPSTNGYNEDAAIAYWKLAIDQMIADGSYEAGTIANPTAIDIDFLITSGSASMVLLGEYIESAFEAAFTDSEHNIYVDIHVTMADFPYNYYSHMMPGEFDLAYGGISGSTLDAASFLDTYSSDNRSGFTLNWGITTANADIELAYTTPAGLEVIEMWSFDAIVSALNGEVYLSEGTEASVPAAKDFTITQNSVEFTIDQFSSPEFENITYTVQWYDLADGYLDVDGMVGITPTDATVLVTGLTPAFDDGSYVDEVGYIGDYQVVINFDYVSDDTKVGESVSPWFMTLSVITDSTITQTATTAAISITLSDDATRTVTSAVVYSPDGAYVEVTGTAVDFADLTAIAVTGLVTATDYQVVFTFDDGSRDMVFVTTD
jgi:ABC-type oligopeptide transport system substrate-binding subunit